ncbi:MAG TPA: phenylalanine--tRNA ligase subunit beta, partial [Patescibacteria group bacterium]|nr:phenylalanine--tRNA ligase subunit beta [Patescibacteria group bacterium]
RTLSKTAKKVASTSVPPIVIQDPRGCSRYIGVAFDTITITESPLWLQVKLLLSGLRPKNNIVDVTNYLMLLTGQPVHAFDQDRIVGTVTIRRAKSNETLTLLTGETKYLSVEDIVIADDQQVLALAGVMGGVHSAVTEQTKNIFLEIATFDGASIRRTKTHHTLPTDASYRYERGLDSNLPTLVVQEAITLITTIVGGRCVGMRDVYPKTVRPTTITLTLARIKNVLGTEISLAHTKKYLEALGLVVRLLTNKKTLTVTVPTRRPDLRDEWDLIEEIGRMHGYEKIGVQAPSLPLTGSSVNPEKIFERSVKQYLAHIGFDEIMTYSFYGEKEIQSASLPLAHHLELANPLSPDQKFLRMTLAP